MASHEQLVSDLRSLGVSAGDVLVAHTSFRAVRPVDGGPRTLIRALRTAIGSDGTLVMPTMTDGRSIFDPARTPTHEMGVTAELFWREPGVVRSSHPGASFAAVGPLAARICAPHPLSPPHGPDSPIGRVHELDGKILLLGVTHAENTTMHLVEALAGAPYSVAHPCVVERDGEAATILIAETDHCCEGFQLADAWLREASLQREARVGSAWSRLVRSRELVRVVAQVLEAEPLVFLCEAGAGCDECDAARASVRSGPG